MNVTNVEDLYELSSFQEGLLFHKLHSPEDEIYSVQFTCVLMGKVDVNSFRRAWQMVVERHTILRTAFIWEKLRHPIQVVYRTVTLPLQVEDWRGVSRTEQQERLDELLKEDRAEGFDLHDAPLMRIALFRLTDSGYRFVWSFHHLLLDGWSMSLVLKEVFTCYESFVRGEDIRLEGSPPYRDYIAWLKDQSREAAEQFWRQELQEVNGPTTISVGHLVSPASGSPGNLAEVRCNLTEAVTAELHALVRQHKLTVNTLLQGVWALLLCRYSGESNVIFGATVAVRHGHLKGVESMVGPLINTLPVRVRVAPDAALVPWLTTLQTRQSEARQYDYARLVDIRSWSHVPSTSPLFESLLDFENYPRRVTTASATGDRIEVRDIHVLERTNYPLTIVVGASGRLSLKLLYDSSRFGVGTVERIAEHLRSLLEGIASKPGACVSSLLSPSNTELTQVVAKWNATEREYPRQTTLHRLIAERAVQMPDAVAVATAGRMLTYGELDRRANQVAHALRAHGVGPDVLVGVCLERSLDLVVGLLGVLKAGGAYVPLDPGYPPERLGFMMKDARVTALLTQAALSDRLPVPVRIPRLDLDGAFGREVAAEPETAPYDRTHPENLAYVIYTSGSSGRPKGVAILHRGVVRLVKGANYARFTPDEVFLHLAPLSFDASTFEVWGALANGARLVLFPEQIPSLEEIGRVIRREGITTMWLTAGLFHQMVDERLEDLRPLRQLLAGGDTLSVSHVQRAVRALPRCKIINGYGPTEGTTFTCCYPVTDLNQISHSVPLGPPIANTQVYILDVAMAPVGVEVPGELYIGGDGLARGYLHRSGLTAERFVPHPFSKVPGARLYRTGDRARWRPDGTLEFLGRLDDQVKLRGFRIELGEVEAVVRQHPDVRDAVVIVCELVPGDKQIVAYATAAPETALSAIEVRRYLMDKLPHFMVPSAVVMMEALPLTPNGKVDRKALSMRKPNTAQKAEYVAPCTPAEEVLAEIWTKVLGLERVGTHDNFFELGGHSLLVTQVISRVCDAFQIEIPLRSLFEAPIIAEFSKTIEKVKNSRSEFREAAIVPIPREAHRVKLSSLTRGPAAPEVRRKGD